MTGAEILIVYGFPCVLVAGGAMMAWRNRVVMRRARERDRARDEVAAGIPANHPYGHDLFKTAAAYEQNVTGGFSEAK